MPFRTKASLWYANSQGTQDNINLSNCQIGYAYRNLSLLKVLIFAHQPTVTEHPKRHIQHLMWRNVAYTTKNNFYSNCVGIFR